VTLSAAILKNKNPIYPGSPNIETGYPVIAYETHLKTAEKDQALIAGFMV